MILKRLMFASIAIVALSASFAFLSGSARGQGASFRLLSPTVALFGGTVYHLETVDAPLGWRAMPYPGWDLPPVPPTSLVSYASGTAVTDAGEGWDRQGGGWVSLGILPSTPTIGATWGQVKAKYLH